MFLRVANLARAIIIILLTRRDLSSMQSSTTTQFHEVAWAEISNEEWDSRKKNLKVVFSILSLRTFISGVFTY